MAGAFGAKINGCRIGLFYDDLELNASGSKARIVGGRIKLDVDQTITADPSTILTWSGGAVTDGSRSPLSVPGFKGTRTLVNVTGQWVTLSSTKEVTATGSVSLSGLSGAGATLTCSTTAVYPKRKGTGTPLPPGTPDPNAPDIPNPWQDDDLPDVYREQLIEHVYLVTMPALSAAVRDVPAWDITVTLDGGRSPYGTATFKAPISYHNDPGMLQATSPFNNVVVVVEAGWRYGTTINRHPIFAGVLTGRRMLIEGDNTFVEFEAESYETAYDFPSHRNQPVSNTHTRVSQFFSSNETSGDPFYRNAKFVDTLAGTPSAAELAEFRAMICEPGDDLGDFLRSCTSALNQWSRGSMTATLPTIEVIRDPYPYTRGWELPLSIFARLDRSSSLGDWANVVQLETSWTNPADGDTKSKKQTYASTNAVSGTEPVRSQQVSIRVKPPGGTTPPKTWPTGLRWLRRLDTMNRANYTGECRAIWWLQPRVDGVTLEEHPLGEGAGAVKSCTFLVDQGLMSLAWSAVLT